MLSLPSYLFTSLLHQSPEPQVTKSPVVHSLFLQQSTKCSSSNSFVLITIHFDGGVPHPPVRTGRIPDRLDREHSGQCAPRANEMPALLGSSVDIRGENDIPKQ